MDAAVDVLVRCGEVTITRDENDKRKYVIERKAGRWPQPG